MGLSEGIFWVDMSGWIFLWVSGGGGQGWVGVHFGCVGVCGHLLWVDVGGWELVEVYFRWVGMGGHFSWVGGGGWTFFMGEWWYILGGWM